ncbi:aspartyl/asparaginyl beta-hydroxylase domain-containing protein [Vibrio sp. ZSDZ65]|uniref:Aspartyl/asparaginyl beta-hydroxylase domain-containing protein n=1 Tax=Vibrio qingdaonensis TaxID=2829491 RepID=A0A9X3CPD2_9VIBR|nr:aspartyl/asparaginyl beta-hydroxylase domain-containing protein [Vibrio qingdaonensis]
MRVLQKYVSAHPILQSFSIEGDGRWENGSVMERCPNISALLARIHAPIQSVRLMRLHPRSHVLPHRDKSLSLEHGEVRLHIPITGDEGVDFFVSDQRVPMAKGEVWYINADQEHQVVNQSEHPRINLVIDCKVSPWLRKQIAESHEMSQMTLCQ